MGRESPDYDSRAAKDALPGGSLGRVSVLYMCTRLAFGRSDVEMLRIIEDSF